MSREQEPAPVMVRAARLSRYDTRDNPWGVTLAEAQVLDLMCDDLLHKQIADKLGISVKTVQAINAKARRRMGYRGHSLMPYLLWDRWRRGQS